MEGIRRNIPLTIRILHVDIYFITDPTDAAAVLNSTFHKDYFYDYFKPWLGEGLLSASERTWKKHYKLLIPTFTQNVLDSYLPELNKEARTLVVKLNAEVGKGKFDHAPYLEHAAFQSFCSSAMGNIIDVKDVELRERYLTAKSKYSSGMTHRAQTFWLHNDFIYNWSSYKKNQTDVIKVLHGITNEIIQKRKQELNQKEQHTAKRFKPFIEHLIELEKAGAFSTLELQEEVDTFTYAGSESVSVTLTNALVAIGYYPDIQRKIFDELQNVFQGSLRDVERPDILQLEYLDAVVKETLRMYPTVPVVGRILDKDIKINNYILPTGGRCYVSLYGVNRHQSWGNDTEQFRPERWLESDVPTKLFGGFGYGKRRCIGHSFALLSTKLMLVHILRVYRISGDFTDLQHRMELVARPVSKDYISIERRTKTDCIGQK